MVYSWDHFVADGTIVNGRMFYFSSCALFYKVAMWQYFFSVLLFDGHLHYFHVFAIVGCAAI